MSNISKVSLEDSLYVLQLAREAALAQNRQAQAKRMAPVVEQMQNLAAPAAQVSTPPSTGVMGQSDFKALFSVTQSRVNQPASADSTASILERNRLIGAMAEANMTDVDIARQFSITRDEVQLVLELQQKNKAYTGGVR